MKSWTIGKRLIVGFCAVITIAVALGGYAAYQILAIHEAAKVITDDALPGVINIDKALLIATKNNVLTLSHIASNDDATMAEIEKRDERQQRPRRRGVQGLRGVDP